MKTYRINVARDSGRRNRYGNRTEIAWEYYFHIELDIHVTRKKAMEIATDIEKRFPADEGFNVSMAEWTVPIGTEIEIEEE